MIKAVVFDVGGVLCDWVTVVKTMAASIGADYQEFYDAFLLYSFDPKTGSDLGLIGMDEFFAKLADHFSRPEKAKVWRQEFVPGFKRIEPTFELVKELIEKHDTLKIDQLDLARGTENYKFVYGAVEYLNYHYNIEHKTNKLGR